MNGQLDLGDITPVRYFATLAIGTGLLLGLVAGDSEGIGSVFFWLLQACIPMTLLVGSQLLLGSLPGVDRLGAAWRIGLSGCLGALLFTPFALLLDTSAGQQAAVGSLPAALWNELAGVAPPVILVWYLINLPWLLGYRLLRPLATDDTPEAQPPFLRLLPRDKQGTLLYLEAELHYLAVVTTAGRHLLLYNLRDAVAELGPGAGIQTHRAFWVATDQVEALRRTGRQGALTISNGDTVPVSRRNLSIVQAWYEEQPPRQVDAIDKPTPEK